MRFENAHSVRFEKWNWLQEVLKSKQPSSPQGAAQGRRAARASAGRLQTGADADGSEITLNASLSAAISASRRFFRSSKVERMSSHEGLRSWRYWFTCWSSRSEVFMASLLLVSSPRSARREEVLEFLRFVVSTRKASFVASSSSWAFTASSSPLTTACRACE